jgi:tRNA 2-thiouridine synthesizing protein E
MNINNKEIEIDAEGYLVHPENWNKEVALVLAKSSLFDIAIRKHFK